MSAVRPAIKLTRHSSTTDKSADFTKLPSYSYRHVNWSDLKNMDILGSELKGPRVRASPTIKDTEFDEVPEAIANYQPHIYKYSSQQEQRQAQQEVAKVKMIKSKIEDWENMTAVNLSYQELGTAFQNQLFFEKLKQLIRCEKLFLVDNRLTDLSKVTLPCVEVLNVSLNLIQSFKNLPKCPKLRAVNLFGNKISSLEGCEVLGNVHEIVIKSNPIIWTIPNYREQLIAKLPNLVIVDGITKDEIEKEGRVAT